MKGCEHFTFHLAGPTELMQAGNRFLFQQREKWSPGGPPPAGAAH
jgi:hypothetical protein